MENEERVERLYFELASESRLSILREIETQSGKLRETARKLDLTTTETFRQLQRLTDALLIQKQPDGNYTITEYGNLILRLSSSFEFLYKRRQFFAMHEFKRLPTQFLNRIGELSKADFSTDMMANINAAERVTKDAEQYMWGGGAEQPLNIRHILVESIPRGVKYKFLFPRKYIPNAPGFPGMERAVEWRALENLPANFVITEKEAAISFCLPDGRTDYVGFLSNDPAFVNWVKELFLYYWDKGERILQS